MDDNGHEHSAPPVRSLPVRVGQVFVSPGALFDALKGRPVWIDATILLIVLSIASQLAIPADIMRNLMTQQMPPGSDPADVDRILDITRRFGVGVALVATPASIAFVAGLILLAYNVLLGGEGRFMQLFSATTHAFLILTAGSLLGVGLLLMGGDQVVLSPALLLPDLGDGYLARVLEKINIFAVWTSIVLGVAVSRIYPGRSAGGAAAYLLVLYGIMIGLFSIPG